MIFDVLLAALALIGGSTAVYGVIHITHRVLKTRRKGRPLEGESLCGIETIYDPSHAISYEGPYRALAEQTGEAPSPKQEADEKLSRRLTTPDGIVKWLRSMKWTSNGPDIYRSANGFVKVNLRNCTLWTYSEHAHSWWKIDSGVIPSDCIRRVALQIRREADKDAKEQARQKDIEMLNKAALNEEGESR